MKIFELILLIGFVNGCNTNRDDSNRLGKDNFSDTISVRQDFKKYFTNCNVNGSITIYDNNQHRWIMSDTTDAKMETLPASTFKIINILVALETGVIKDENEIVEWVGKTDTSLYGYRPDIYHGMTVKEAFQVSAGWVFLELAKKIGKENYKKFLAKCDYGNANISDATADFWNFGSLGITPVNQIEFLKKLYSNDLPFSRRNIDIVKSVMITVQNENFTIRGKTGQTKSGENKIGWWVGYIETAKGVFFFATRITQLKKSNDKNFRNCRIDVTNSILKELNVIQSTE